MNNTGKIIGASIITGAGIIGLSISSLVPRGDPEIFPLIVTFIGVCLMVSSWTGRSVLGHIKYWFQSANEYENFENRLKDEEEG